MPYENIHDTNWWLDRVKERHQCKTDAELSRLLFTTKQAISMQRKGTSAMQVKSAVRAAELLEVNPMLVICGTMHQMAHTQEDKTFWLGVFDRVQYNGDDRRRWLARASTGDRPEDGR